MNLLQAIILAIVEGLTEFLPVSSTGHLIVTSSIMGIAKKDFTKLFTIVIQFGAILSVVVLYWKRFLGKIDFDFYKKLFIAFIPAAVLGYLLKEKIDTLLESPIEVGAAFLIGGIIFLLLDNWFKKAEERGADELKSNASAFKIGLFQTISIIPGVSRSAATIIGGLTQKLNKKAAAEFSFFLAVPTMLGATVLESYKYIKGDKLHPLGHVIHSHDIKLLLIGNAIAFIVALIVIRTFINYLTKHGFKVFGYYRIAAGLVILILHWAGVELNML